MLSRVDLNNFSSIGHSMRLLFQITSGQPLTALIVDLETFGRTPNLVVPFFFMWFIIGNFVYINLFIALVLENFVSAAPQHAVTRLLTLEGICRSTIGLLISLLVNLMWTTSNESATPSAELQI
eukprot:COSAG01_NODE_1399_length_10465_cov_3.558267_8_plen_124_part_00